MTQRPRWSRGSVVVERVDAERGVTMARRRFEETVIEPALHKVSPAQVRYLIAMADDCDGSSRTSEIAQRLGKSSSETSVLRDRLIKSGLVDATAWGRIRFAIPHMAFYLQRHREEILREISGADR